MISIIIVTYNSTEYIYNCLDSIYRNFKNNTNFEIIIVDNGSLIQPQLNNYNNLKIIINNKNIGYSKALNQGVKVTKGSFIIALNPDTFISKGYINDLYKYLKSDIKIGVVGCKMLTCNGEYQLSSMRRFPHVLCSIVYLLKLYKIGFINYYNYADKDTALIQKVDNVSGAFMIFSKQMFNSIGGFNENYFLYFEDTHFCCDVKKNGYEVIYHPSLEIVHYKGSSTDLLSYIDRKYYFIYSLIYFFLSHFKEYKVFLFNIILFLYIFLK